MNSKVIKRLIRYCKPYRFILLFIKLLVITIVIVLTALVQWLLGQLTNKITYNITNTLRNSVFEKIHLLPLKYLDRQPRGDIINRAINDIDLIGTGLLQSFTSLFTGIATIIGTILIMCLINLSIAIVVIVLTPLSLVVASIIVKRTHIYFKEQLDIRSEMNAYIEEMIGNQKLIKAYNYENINEDNFLKINQKMHVSGVKSQFYGALINPTTRVVNNLVYGAVGVFGAISVINGHFSVGMLSSFLTYANQYTKPFNEISGVVTEMQNALACAARILELVDVPDEMPDKENAAEFQSQGQVSLSHVSFSYDPDKPLIEDLNLEVKPGQRIAIVGPTGCGKTTLINLLMRFYDVRQGSIKIDGTDIRDMTRHSLRQNFGMVLQDTWLKAGTIRENIAYGKPEASMEEVIEAAKAAHAHGFIRRLPKGYDTVISENGGNISQGQKQLLCIARVMLCLPPMLILDEATSNIDTRTEIRIQEAFARMMKGRTSFLVAHRLSTIREADVILVMKDGHILEKGTHESLMARHGFYEKLYNSQFGG